MYDESHVRDSKMEAGQNTAPLVPGETASRKIMSNNFAKEQGKHAVITLRRSMHMS